MRPARAAGEPTRAGPTAPLQPRYQTGDEKDLDIDTVQDGPIDAQNLS
jgi:hypothetical protein